MTGGDHPVGRLGRQESAGHPARRPSYGQDPGRDGIALSLSGGGFRAAFYHLGALRCANDLGVLHRLRAISAVSGGSLLAAHLAMTLPWPLLGPIDSITWEQRVAEPFRRFAARDRRTWPILWGTVHPRSSQVREFARACEQLVRQARVVDLPTTPSFILCATNLTHGGLWQFQQSQWGDEVFGFESPPPADLRLSLAMAASACLAPFIAPLRQRIADTAAFDGGRRRTISGGGPATVWLSDGGVFDNLGLEAVWRSYATLLVSDAGAPLTYEWDGRLFGRLRSTLRAADLNDQFGRLARRRWFISRVEERVQPGAYWGIASSVTDIADFHDVPGFPGYSASLVRDVLARVRTDLDAFSDVEQRVLENHGYMNASAALQSWGAPGLGLTGPVRPLAPPHGGDYLDEQWIRRELWASDDRTRVRRLARGAVRGVAGLPDRVRRLVTRGLRAPIEDAAPAERRLASHSPDAPRTKQHPGEEGARGN